MARLSLTFLLLLSLLSLSLARFHPEPDRPDVESQPSFLPQLPNPESESESETTDVPQLPTPEIEKEEERDNQIIELPGVVPEQKPEEKPEIAEEETVQYIVVPVHRFRDVRNFENLQDIGFSLRLPMRHGHHHRRHRFDGFGHRFGHKFRHGMMRGFEGRGYDRMEDAEGRKMERPEMPEMPMHMKEERKMDEHEWNHDFTQMPMEDEDMERVKEMMKRKRKCKHHHMEKGMMHRHHEHHHGPREEPREGPRGEGEEGGFISQLWNLFNF